MQQRFPSPVLIVAAVIFALGFAVSLEQSSVRWIGDRVEASYRDHAALVAGPLTILVALVALAMIRAIQPRHRTLHALAAVALVIGGALHIARGVGAFWSPPRPPGFAFDERPALPAPPPPAAPGGSTTAAPPTPSSDELKLLCRDDPTRCAEFRAALDAACARDDVERCAQLAAVLAEGTGGPVDEARGRAVAKKACDARDGLGCSNLAFFAMEGKGGPKDLQVAFDAAVFGCRGGVNLGCRNVAAVVQQEGLQVDPGARQEALAIACDDWVERACELLADELLALDRDDRLADTGHVVLRAALLRLCQMVNRVACRYVAEAATKGLGGSADPELAGRAARRACRLGDTDRCGAGEAPRGAPVSAWATRVTASDGGDHLDRLGALEDAWSPCAAAASGGAWVAVEIELVPGESPVLRAQGAEAVVDCLVERFPWRDRDPTPPPSRVTLALELRLHA